MALGKSATHSVGGFFSSNAVYADPGDRLPHPRGSSTRNRLPGEKVILRATCTVNWAPLTTTFVSNNSAFDVGR